MIYDAIILSMVRLYMTRFEELTIVYFYYIL